MFNVLVKVDISFTSVLLASNASTKGYVTSSLYSSHKHIINPSPLLIVTPFWLAKAVGWEWNDIDSFIITKFLL